MNNNIEEALWKDYNDLGEILNVMQKDDERKSNILEERDKIRNELIKLELGKGEIEVKKEEINSNNERDKKQNIINISMFGVSTLLSLYAIVRTFNFDQESTITSTLGRNILNNVMPKLFKK